MRTNGIYTPLCVGRKPRRENAHIRLIVALIHTFGFMAWSYTKPLDWQDLILETAGGKNPRGK